MAGPFGMLVTRQVTTSCAERTLEPRERIQDQMLQAGMLRCLAIRYNNRTLCLKRKKKVFLKTLKNTIFIYERYVCFVVQAFAFENLGARTSLV